MHFFPTLRTLIIIPLAILSLQGSLVWQRVRFLESIYNVIPNGKDLHSGLMAVEAGVRVTPKSRTLTI